MPSRPAFASVPAAEARPQGCTNLRLHRLSRVVGRQYEAHLRPLGLTTAQYAVLSHVVLLGPVGLSALAAELRVDASTLTRTLQGMTAAGWVELQPGADARSRQVVATADGAALRARAQRAWKQAQLALNAQLGEARVAALHALLDDCLGTLEAPAGDDA